MKQPFPTCRGVEADSESDISIQSQSSRQPHAGQVVTSHSNIPNIGKWEALYIQLDRACRDADFNTADKLYAHLLDSKSWDKRILVRPWSCMPDGSIRKWDGMRSDYPRQYRIIDGLREGWICLLMDYCKWDQAIRLSSVYIDDPNCIYLTGKAQMALNRLHSFLESRRVQEATHFFETLIEGQGKMRQILRIIEQNFTYDWHYSLARIRFLNKDYDIAQHHAELACHSLEFSRDTQEQPLQSRLWVAMIRAYTRGLACLKDKDSKGLLAVIDLWESTVCDLDRKSTSNTIGLKKNSIFGRIKFIEFLMGIMRACSELDVRSYEDIVNDSETQDLVSLNKTIILKIRSIANELTQKEGLSVEVTNSSYCSSLDEALTEVGYLSVRLQGLVDNWAVVIDGGPVGNQGRYANHCDDPNAVLAIGQSDAGRVRVIKAIKPIARNDEITVHYGVNYWDAMHENRQSSMYQKYTCDAPVITCSNNPKKKRKKEESPSAGEIYRFEPQYPFKFYDGIVSDLNGSGLPPLVLLQSMGETGTCPEAFDMDVSCRKKGLRVEDCPPTHAAYPGKMLVADRDFKAGEEVCLYAGVMIKMPVERLRLRDTDYMTTVCNSTCGPYGFELEDIHANHGCVFKKNQPGLPSPPVKSPEGRQITNTYPPVDLSGIEDIKGLGHHVTKQILKALQDERYHDMLARLLKRVNNLPDKQWKSHAQGEFRRAFAAFNKRLDTDTAATLDDIDVIDVQIDCSSASEGSYKENEVMFNVTHAVESGNKGNEVIVSGKPKGTGLDDCSVWMPAELRAHIKMSSNSRTTSPTTREALWNHDYILSQLENN